MRNKNLFNIETKRVGSLRSNLMKFNSIKFFMELEMTNNMNIEFCLYVEKKQNEIFMKLL